MDIDNSNISYKNLSSDCTKLQIYFFFSVKKETTNMLPSKIGSTAMYTIYLQMSSRDSVQNWVIKKKKFHSINI